MSAFNLAGMLAHHADRFPDRPCLVWGDEVVSYAGLETRAARTAAGLAKLGLRRGDVVAVILYNCPEFHTGDVGRLDADGFLYIADRKKDMIVSGGENIASPEVERVLYEHPAVLEASVVGRPDPRWGEVPVAFVVPREGAKPDAETLQEFCRTRLAKFKIPRAVHFIDRLPRNPSGKVLKRVLREQAAAGQPPAPSS